MVGRAGRGEAGDTFWQRMTESPEFFQGVRVLRSRRDLGEGEGEPVTAYPWSPRRIYVFLARRSPPRPAPGPRRAALAS